MRNRSVWLIFSGVLLFVLHQSCQSNPYKHGEILYQNFCANCHMEDGTGLEGLIPPLAQADYLQEFSSKTACIIRFGINEEIMVNGKTYKNPMEGIPQLSDTEITNVINYIHHAWGNDYGYVKFEEVRAALRECEGD